MGSSAGDQLRDPQPASHDACKKGQRAASRSALREHLLCATLPPAREAHSRIPSSAARNPQQPPLLRLRPPARCHEAWAPALVRLSPVAIIAIGPRLCMTRPSPLSLRALPGCRPPMVTYLAVGSAGIAVEARAHHPSCRSFHYATSPPATPPAWSPSAMVASLLSDVQLRPHPRGLRFQAPKRTGRPVEAPTSDTHLPEACEARTLQQKRGSSPCLPSSCTPKAPGQARPR